MQKLSEKVLLENITNEQIQGKIIFYSYADKSNKILGSTRRLIVFSKMDNMLTYMSDSTKLPFGDLKKLESGNKSRIQASSSNPLNEPKSKILKIKGKLMGKQNEEEEWQFEFKNQGLAQQWLNLLLDHKKDNPMNNALPKKQEYNQINNNNNPQSNNPNQTYQNNPNYGQNQSNQQKQPNLQNQLYAPNNIQNSKNPNTQSNNNPANTQSKYNNLHPQYNNSNQNTQNNPNTKNSPNSQNNNNSPNAQSNYSGDYNKGKNIQNNYNSGYDDKPDEEDNTAYLLNNSKFILTKDPVQSTKNNQPSPTRHVFNNPKQSRYNPQDSRHSPQQSRNVQSDWNYKFLMENSLDLIYDFEKMAQKIGMSKIADFQKNPVGQYQEYDEGNIIVTVAEGFTSVAKYLKSQYRNYHYILECTQDRFIVGVPLVTLVEHHGFLAQVKAPLPKQAPVIKKINQVDYMLKSLEERTKILNATLTKGNCKIYDLSDFYGTNGDLPLLYFDHLNEYLPQLTPSRKELKAFSMRPQLIFESVSGKLMGGNLENSKYSKLQNDIFGLISDQIQDLGDFLSSEDLYISNIADLKQLLHFRGVNMKLLFKLLGETKNKFVKKYVQTCLAAKIVKDTIFQIIKDIMSQKKGSITAEELVEDQIRSFIEGHSSSNSEMWKRLSMAFRNQYGISLSTHELEGGFFLGCLMTLIPADYDLNLINKRKVIFQDSDIIGQGFVRRLLPKVKSYYRFQNKLFETAKYSKKEQKQCKRMIQVLQLNKRSIPDAYCIHNEKKYILAYLSDFVDPSASGQYQISNPTQIYNLVNHEPPSTATIKITLNYLGFKLMADNNQDQKKLEKEIHKSIEIVNYWLGEEHPQICEFYDKLSSLKIKNNEVEEGLGILQRSRQIAQKTEAKNKSKLGSRYYILGEQYLRTGSKKDALHNLQKARQCLADDKDKEHEYALTLMKLSSLDLNSGKVAQSIALAEEALKNGKSSKLKDRYMLKIYEILSRGHEILGNKDELKKIGIKCSKEFNDTDDIYIFGQMIKISLAGVFSKISVQRANNTVEIVKKLREQGRILSEQQSVYQLMTIARQKRQPVIERMLTKIDLAQKVWGDMKEKKPLSGQFNEFVQLLGLSAGAVGVDFLEGLQSQKQFE